MMKRFPAGNGVKTIDQKAAAGQVINYQLALTAAVHKTTELHSPQGKLNKT